MRKIIWAVVMVVGLASSASAQQIPPPSGPVTFCGVQQAPTADSYLVAVDGGAPVPVAMLAPDAACPAGATHSFQIAAASFPIGAHTVQITAVNAFGSTAGPVYNVVVGIAPGPFAIVAIIPPGE